MLKANYDFTDWLSLQLRGGTDLYTETRQWQRANNTLFEVGSPNRAKFQESRVRVQETNYDALLTAEGDLSDDFSGELRVGGNRLLRDLTIDGFQGSGTSVPNFFTPSNAVTTTPINSVSRREIQSVYALGEIGFRDYAFLSVTGRNDWSSTLPEDNRSFFYPSVSGSVILTDALNLDLPSLSYAKLRASWAQTGNDANPFQLNPTFELGGSLGGSFSGQNYASVADELPNVDLEPEITSSVEVGTDLRFFDERLQLEATYYTQTTENQVVNIPISSPSGFSSRVVNVGEVQNSGFEGRIQGTVLETESLQWDLSFNAAANDSEVRDFPGDITTQLLGTSRSGVQIIVEEGEPFGQIIGDTYKRNENGEIIVDQNGIPKTGERDVIGNFQPDWTGGAGTTVRWNNLSLRALFDIRQGGEIYSFSNVVAHERGNHKATLRGREDGFVFDGVTENGQPNDVSVDPQTFWANVATTFEGAIDEEFVYDASYVRLRELAISYQLPGNFLATTPLQGAQIRLTGKNLFFLERHTDGFDPSAYARSSASSIQGIEYGSFPNTRSYGVNVTLRF
jgi:outer membrane receptor protein involved in Fe transport